jgi:hypothetical protein
MNDQPHNVSSSSDDSRLPAITAAPTTAVVQSASETSAAQNGSTGASGASYSSAASTPTAPTRSGWAKFWRGFFMFVGIASVVAAIIVLLAMMVPGGEAVHVNFGDDLGFPLHDLAHDGPLGFVAAVFIIAIVVVVLFIAFVFAALVTILSLLLGLGLATFSLVATLALIVAPIAIPLWIAYLIGRNRGTKMAKA